MSHGEQALQGNNGEGIMLVDLDFVDHNINFLRNASPGPVRLVTKSIPSFPLLEYIMEKLPTNRIM